jgi:hypothetical protein
VSVPSSGTDFARRTWRAVAIAIVWTTPAPSESTLREWKDDIVVAFFGANEMPQRLRGVRGDTPPRESKWLAAPGLFSCRDRGRDGAKGLNARI